jgi:DNA-binding NarL/FixJ family response regulator
MPPISVLIADDDAKIRQCLRRALEADPQLQVLWEADNGLEALVLAKQHHPQVILMDVQMPRMDGIEATRCLRQHDHKMCILIMSVYENVRAQALAAGADGFVTKDCGCRAMRAAVHDALVREDQQPTEATPN